MSSTPSWIAQRDSPIRVGLGGPARHGPTFDSSLLSPGFRPGTLLALKRCERSLTTLRRARKTELNLTKQVLAYFVHNPGAADSAEGIARWRIMDEKIRSTVQETFAVLRWLVEEGYLDEISTRGAGSIFRLNTDRIDDARELIASSPLRRRRKPRENARR